MFFSRDNRFYYLKNFLTAFGLAGIILLVPLLSPAQERNKVLNVQKLAQPPKIDGWLNDEAWQAIQPVGDFIQYDPVNGAPASEETLVWAGYDDRYIYFGFKLKDSRPEKSGLS